MRRVKEYPSLFSITEKGELWSHRSNRFLKKTKSKKGYYNHATKIGGRKGKAILLRIHRLVAEAYVPNPQDKPFVNHKDGDKLNNHKDNLEWVTDQENKDHAWAIGLCKVVSGLDHGLTVLTEEDVLFIKSSDKTSRELAGLLGVHHTTVSSARRSSGAYSQC